MGLAWCFHGKFVVLSVLPSCFHGNFMALPWDVLGASMVPPCDWDGTSMGISWCFHDYSVVVFARPLLLWRFSGTSVVRP